jgi:hypothetical protein
VRTLYGESNEAVRDLAGYTPEEIKALREKGSSAV